MDTTEALYQNDMVYAMTVQRAKTFCLSLEGIFLPQWGFKDAIEVCLKSHAVRIKPASPTSRHPVALEHAVKEGPFKFDYACDCQGFWHALICSHVLAACHLTNEIDLIAMTAVIDRPCKAGRPTKYSAVTYAAHKAPERKDNNKFTATQLIGSTVSVRVEGDRVYDGQVNSVFEGINHEGEPCMIYKVCYKHQYEEDLPTMYPKYEEFTLQRLEQGISLFKEMQKRRKTNNAINCDC